MAEIAGGPLYEQQRAQIVVERDRNRREAASREGACRKPRGHEPKGPEHYGNRLRTHDSTVINSALVVVLTDARSAAVMLSMSRSFQSRLNNCAFSDDVRQSLDEFALPGICQAAASHGTNYSLRTNS